MALAFLWERQKLWPFSVLNSDDLRVSCELVDKLPIPEQTKRFVFAFCEPETQSVIYVLSTQAYSGWSSMDAECLIREVRPDAVVVKETPLMLMSVEIEEEMSSIENAVPSSTFEVLKRCFKEKVGADSYRYLALGFIARAIFGADCFEHVLAAKRAAKDVGSSFMFLESPWIPTDSSTMSSSTLNGDHCVEVSKFQGLASSMVPQKVQCDCSCVPGVGSRLTEMDEPTQCSYKAPHFAQTIYMLCEEFHDIMVNDTPSMDSALANVRKLLDHVNRGEAVDAQVVSEVYPCQNVREEIRIIHNYAARLPIRRTDSILRQIGFSELAPEKKSHALSAQALRSLTKKFKTTVAVVDAEEFSSLRKYWYTHIPPGFKDLVPQLVTESEENAVGEVSGGSTLSELARASMNNLKVILKIPTTSDFVIRVAESTSLWAIRTAWYEMMIKRKGRLPPSGPFPRFLWSANISWGLFSNRAGIRCAVESIPAAASVARLGRGIQSLSHASRAVKNIEESLGFSRRTYSQGYLEQKICNRFDRIYSCLDLYGQPEKS